MKHTALLLLIGLLLTSCGGSGGGTDTTNNTIAGSALAGQPLADGTLTVINSTDSHLSSSQATFDIADDGTFSIDETTLNGLGNGPYLLKAEGTAGDTEKTLYGIAFQSDQGQTNFIISPFSEAMLVIATGQSIASIEADPSHITSITLEQINIANNNLI